MDEKEKCSIVWFVNIDGMLLKHGWDITEYRNVITSNGWHSQESSWTEPL